MEEESNLLDNQPDASTTDGEDKMTDDEIIDHLFEKSGGFGRWQCLYAVILIIGLTALDFVFYSLGFLLEEPKYDCVTQGNPPEDFECNQ